jgi:hypothetical protein
MKKTRERRPGQGAASDNHVIENSNDGNIADPGSGPQPSPLQSFRTDAGYQTTSI